MVRRVGGLAGERLADDHHVRSLAFDIDQCRSQRAVVDAHHGIEAAHFRHGDLFD